VIRIRSRKERELDREERMREAESAGSDLEQQEADLQGQLGLVSRLTEGWRRVHEQNHLAQLFREEGWL